MFVNEDLTKHRSALLFEARKLSRVDLIQGAWSSDGNIFVKDNAAVVDRINKLGDLFQFGYLLMGPGQPRLFPRRPAGLALRKHAYSNTVEPRYLELAYFELPLISK